ncbi:M3 family metallopeptidase [Shewanella litorisediminis]|uniref:Uncharacterized protein n=1 Tax=Shewanella litorisediminis TaxID=1173586 RepID=A0ABX7FYM2_9GAMM|nr:M3 family metallopeptidase [Shewanella litorisediminis]MCL2919279.1 M3 family metallopeptidase [Shewanella litorisediminis]QRH00130.1 hypothetical protein JQC75_09390 [Shewanella litorisediminis]
MPKRISALTLTASLWCTAAIANPVSLLAEQCQQLTLANDFAASFDSVSLSSIQDPPSAAIQASRFERLTLGFNNLSSQVSLYLSEPLSRDDRDLLVNCQIRLADEISLVSSSEAFLKLGLRLQTYGEADSAALGNTLNRMAVLRLSSMDKARLHTAEASFMTSHKRGEFSLHPGDDCKITDESKSSQAQISHRIATYLSEQADENCRENAWKAYQSRTKTSSHGAMNVIHDIRKSQAMQQGFIDYASLVLKDTFFASPDTAATFLQATRPDKTLPPWNIGRALKQAEGTRQPINSNWLLKALLEEAHSFGVRVDWLSDKHLRLWLGGRLLGELVIATGKSPAFQLTRPGIFTRQFGQGLLISPEELKGRGAADDFIHAFARAIASLSHTQRHYLLVRQNEYDDGRALAATWLAIKLGNRLNARLPGMTPREAIVTAHRQSQNYYRAALALDFYRHRPAGIDRFAEHFEGLWPDVDAQYQSAVALVQQGPLLYRELWQQRLSRFIATHQQPSDEQAFELLLVNPDQHSLSLQLTSLLGRSYTAEELIRSIADDLR